MPDLEASRSEPQHGNGPHHGYDPNQPRVPSGHSDGGQWTKTPGGGTPAIARREAVVDHSKQESWGSTSDKHQRLITHSFWRFAASGPCFIP